VHVGTYTVPADNPFVGTTSHHGEKLDPATVRTEIWATGLRNVWRFSFDPPTGRLFAGDVGQNLYEEVDLIEKGGDYGWSYREGLHAFDLGPGKDMPPAGFSSHRSRSYEYPRTTGLSITGGCVYHGTKFPEFSDTRISAPTTPLVSIIVLREQEGAWRHEIIAVENCDRRYRRRSAQG
jgi:glucose/arabinose dehydrogenase